jgi:hypothetical protein
MQKTAKMKPTHFARPQSGTRTDAFLRMACVAEAGFSPVGIQSFPALCKKNGGVQPLTTR